MISQITEYIVFKLNNHLSDAGYAVRFKYSTVVSLTSQMEAVLPNVRGLKDYSLNISDELYEFITRYFEHNYGVALSHNNTRTIFWVSGNRLERNDSI